MFKFNTSALRVGRTVAAFGCVAFMMTANAQITPYSQDFEGYDAAAPDALCAAPFDDCWGIFGNVFTPMGDFIFGYGPFTAPNDGSGWSGVVVGEGGPDQGAQQLVIYNDYGNDAAHDAGNLVESNAFQQRNIVAGDVGKTWVFQYDAKGGDMAPPSTGVAFIRTISPAPDFFLTNNVTNDTSALPATWGTYSLQLEIVADLVGSTFQFGFGSTATSFNPSANFYDNVSLTELVVVDTDGDGVDDSIDNCTINANPGQQDTDGDLIGDRCDGDYTNDCVVNFSDISQFAPQFLGTNPLFDHDSSGAVNFADYSILTSYFLQPPGPSAAGCN